MRRRNRGRMVALCCTSMMSLAAAAQGAKAQPAGRATESAEVSDIIVTARLRAEPIQQAPLAVSAIDSNRLQQTRTLDVTELGKLAPSLNIELGGSNPAAVFPFLRGFGSRSSDPAYEPAVSVYLDGVYQDSINGALVNLFDVEAVEVLRGPQGTLFGKNSPAGAILVRKRRPGREFAGMVQVDYGRFDDFQIRGYVDVPLIADKLTTTFSWYHRAYDGYIKNIPDGRRLRGVKSDSWRGAFVFTPSSDINWYFNAQYDRNRPESPGNRNISTSDPEQLRIPTVIYPSTPPVSRTCTSPYSEALCANPNFDRGHSFSNSFRHGKTKDFSLTSDFQVDSGPATFVSLTSFRKYDQFLPTDLDGTPLLISHPVDDFSTKRFSQEFRIASSSDGGLDMGGRLNWLIGAYYYWWDYERLLDYTALGTTVELDQNGTTTSWALFAHAEYDITDALQISGGIRQTWDHKRHHYENAAFHFGLGPAVSEEASWKDLSVDASVRYEFSPTVMAYFRYAEGYRGGGFVGVPSSAAVGGSFDPETVTAYELGLKSDLFHRKLRLNISAFKNKYKDLQRAITLPSSSPPFFLQVTRNIAAATTQGVEVEIEGRPIRELTLRGSVGYLDAHYDSFFANLIGTLGSEPTDNSDLRFTQTSKWTAAVGAEYRVDLGNVGGLTLAADYSYRSAYNLTDFDYAFGNQKGYGLLTASATWTDPSDRFGASIYGKNLTNEKYLYFADPQGGLTTVVGDGAPRTWGVSLRYKF